MENKIAKISKYVKENDSVGIAEMLHANLDPNFRGGWPLRLAARSGSFAVARILVQFGANPHLLEKSGASTLQLAVYSGVHWKDDSWQFLLSCCNSSQLADGAAVAIVFRQLDALRLILRTGRCNTNVPTTLTGRTVEDLTRSYNLTNVLEEVSPPIQTSFARLQTQRVSGNATTIRESARLSPSVAHFFASAQQTSLSPQQPTHPLHTHATYLSPFHTTSSNTTTSH